MSAAGRGWRFALLGLCLLALTAGTARAESLSIRIAWGGGSDRQWEGSVSVEGATLRDFRPLGMEPDSPGSMWIDGDRLVIRQRGPRSYDGLDLTLEAELQSKLTVELRPVDDAEHPGRVAATLGSLLSEVYDRPLDSQGNRVLVNRSPGDGLQVRLPQDALIFGPGETFRLELAPHLLPVADGAKLQLKVQLVGARSQREFWAGERLVDAGAGALTSVDIPLPQAEGVYDVIVTATENAGLAGAVRRPLQWNKAVAERKVQLLVLDTQRPAGPFGSDKILSPVLTIDPANPRWSDLLARVPQLAKIPRLWKGPLGNGHMQVAKHPLGDLVRLAPSRESPDLSWEAYLLPIGQPGVPHVLEVDYPSDVPQTLGISILETNAAGALMPIGVDSGVVVEQPLIRHAGGPRWLKHRLVFWPRTANPILLMTNRRPDEPAMYGKIRLMAGWDHLPRVLPAAPGRGQRLLAAYYDRPLFPENFAAGEALDRWSGHSLDDWGTFYDGGTRLVEYLNHVGYNGLLLCVMADGSTIFPAERLKPSPRFDKGALFATGQDPVRKDVLEMLLRLFDREQLRLIPALEFNFPLPELEAALREGGPEAEAIEWIGPEGKSYREAYSRPGAAPCYNVLDPRVQSAMLRVVADLVARYGHHPSFAGLALQLSSGGYAQLPGPEWGMDDATMARFQADTQLVLPGGGPERYAQRAALLAGEHRGAWLGWRAQQLGRFYRAVQQQVTSERPDGRLYLSGANLLAGSEVAYQLRPALTRRNTMADALLRAGISASLYQEEHGPVLLQSGRIAPPEDRAERALSQEIAHMPDFDRYFQTLSGTGSLFFHKPQETRLDSFDRVSPIDPTYTWLVAQPVPSDAQNRRRFVHALAALDAQVLADGGWLLPVGQEDALSDVVAAFRRLPAVRFETVAAAPGAAGSQPVTFRAAMHGGLTYLYAANDAPFAVSARVRVEAPPGCRLEELTGRRQVAPLRRDEGGAYWSVELKSYDLVAVQFSEPTVVVSSPRVVLPEAVSGALETRIRQLGARAALLRSPSPLGALGNPGFEQAASGGDRLPQWATTARLGVDIQADATQPHSGRQAARLASEGPIACLVSRPFAAPATGRLSMSVWLRVADRNRQPPLRLALEGKLNGQSYYRFAPVGQSPVAGQPGAPIDAQWMQYLFQLDDLPLAGLTQLRVRFDLMAAGEVWIDDVEVFDLAFSESELRELAKLITLAELQLQGGQVGDCLRLLEGYWPRFLEANVPLPPSALAEQPPVGRPASGSASSAKPPAQPRTGVLDKVKGLLPESLRF